MFEANGECEWTIMYNSCPEREIMTCESFSLDEYQEMQTYDCMEDFLDADFWHEFREEEWWTLEENAVHMELWMFWDSYHMNSGDDYHYWEPDYENCEWKEYNLRCSDFEQEDHDYDYYPVDDYETESDCDIFLYYNPCVTDYFECEYKEDGDYEMWEDCTDEFTDVENWMELREDSFWFRPENYDMMDFYSFWDMYHMNGDNDDYNTFDDYEDYEDYDGSNCWWRELSGTCDELTWTEDVCTWFLSWSPCEEDYFVCDSYTLNEYNVDEYRDCSEDFTDIEFWTVMREENIWHNPED